MRDGDECLEHIDGIEIANNLTPKRSIAVSVRRKKGDRLQAISVYGLEGFVVTPEDHPQDFASGDTARDLCCSSAMRSILLKFSSRTGFVRMLFKVVVLASAGG
jgi:hypothetical protein